MNAILLPALFCLSGFCLYAAFHHGFIALNHQTQRVHPLFACLCLTIAFYVVAKARGYGADSAETLVHMRRLELSAAAIFYALLPWFISSYTGIRSRWIPPMLSVLFMFLFVANLWLPYGLSYMELPKLEYMQLPWGERVADVRVHQRQGLYNVGWLGILAIFIYGFWACARQYRRGVRQRTRALGIGLGLFLLLTLFNQVVNFGLVYFIHTAEFGFAALIIVINQELIRERTESRLHMQAVFDNLPTIIYMKDRDGRYLTSNRRHHEFLDPPDGLVIGKTDHDLFPAKQAETLLSNDREVLQGLKHIEFEETIQTLSEARTFISHKFPLLADDGTPYAVCGVSTEVTDLRKVERERDVLRQQVWHADRVERTGVLAASLAHELSQPLTAILSNAQAGLRFLGRDSPDFSEITAILQDIVRDEKRANGVINGLRSMLRRQDMPREVTDLCKSVEEVLDLLHSELVFHNIHTDVSTSGPCIVQANKAQIQQVLINLVMNASDAMASIPEHARRLSISVVCKQAQAEVAVRDCGLGIEENDLSKVFAGFYTTKSQGLGMGLTMCRSIIESHNGVIRVEKNEDAGVTFSFCLPLNQAESIKPV